MGNPKRHEGVGKDRSPGIDPHGHRPMKNGGDRQPTRSDWREQAQQRQAEPSGPQQAEADPRRGRMSEELKPDDRRSNDASGETEGTGDAERKHGSR